MKCIRSASIALDAFGRKKRKKEKKTIFLDPLERIAFKGHPWKKKTITSAVLIYMLALKGEGSVVAGSVRYRLLDDGKKKSNTCWFEELLSLVQTGRAGRPLGSTILAQYYFAPWRLCDTALLMTV